MATSAADPRVRRKPEMREIGKTGKPTIFFVPF
jgi:hypothetical protein